MQPLCSIWKSATQVFISFPHAAHTMSWDLFHITHNSGPCRVHQRYMHSVFCIIYLHIAFLLADHFKKSEVSEEWVSSFLQSPHVSLCCLRHDFKNVYCAGRHFMARTQQFKLHEPIGRQARGRICFVLVSFYILYGLTVCAYECVVFGCTNV
jgi:hypothetical protein